MAIFVDPCFDQGRANHPPPSGALAQAAQRRDVQVGAATIQVWTGGQAGHVDWLQAIIPPAALRQGAPPNQTVRDQLRAFGNGGDDAGHIIAANLGGPGDQLWNFFAQSPNINRGVWAQQEQICAIELGSGRQVRLCFQFRYDGTNRPTSFDYCYKLANGSTLTNNLVNP